MTFQKVSNTANHHKDKKNAAIIQWGKSAATVPAAFCCSQNHRASVMVHRVYHQQSSVNQAVLITQVATHIAVYTEHQVH